jgi:arylsulfatase A-like enzyme
VKSPFRRAFDVARLVAAGLVFSGCGPDGPDVLVLVMDTARADRCSFLGYERPTTPHLERLATESVVFSDAWSPSPWTPVAHAALFTGRRPDRLDMLGPRLRPPPEEVRTLAEVLSDAGWDTACFTGNPWISEPIGLTRGFDEVAPVYEAPVADAERTGESHRRALDWMKARRRAGDRFFAFVNDVDPHATWDPPEEFTRKFVDPSLDRFVVDSARRLQMPRTAAMSVDPDPIPDDVRRAVSGLYDAEIAHLDARIGELIDGMRSAGLLDDTLVVIVGDHGEGLGDHDWLEHGAFLHRELLRVPLLVRPPGGCEARRVGDVVRLEDVFSTVLDVCRVAAPCGTDGISVLGELPGRVAIATERVPDDLNEPPPGAESHEAVKRIGARRRSIYDGRHHLIVDTLGSTELYDVTTDPEELHDRAAARPAVVRELRAQLDR